MSLALAGIYAIGHYRMVAKVLVDSRLTAKRRLPKVDKGLPSVVTSETVRL